MGEAKIGAVLQFPAMRLRASELAATGTGNGLATAAGKAFGFGAAGRRVAVWTRSSGAYRASIAGRSLRPETTTTIGTIRRLRPEYCRDDECELREEDGMEKVMDSGEAAGVDPGIGLLCDIELDATLQFGSREMPLARGSGAGARGCGGVGPACVGAGRPGGRRPDCGTG